MFSLAALIAPSNTKTKLPAALNGDDRPPLIRLRGLEKTYSNAAGHFTVLKDINVDIYPGEFVGVIGKSGSGKSTLINMITGIDRPTQGEIFVGDQAVHKLSENRMAVWRGRNLGIVFQFFQLLPMLSLLENIMLPMDFCRMYTPRERKRRAMELLDMVEMADHARKLPSAISGGQQQRVAIARALANDPPILVADEPTGNLDSKTAANIFRVFETLVSQGKTILMVTHDSALAQRASRTMLIADGEIVNEYLARALPSLTHQQLLAAMHQLESQHFEPGETILKEGQPAGNFYIVSQGQVEVALHRPGGSDVIAARMNPGEYFGEIELLHGGAGSKCIATIRAAAHTPVEVLALDRSEFESLMTQSADTEAAIRQVAGLREAENISTRAGAGPAPAAAEFDPAAASASPAGERNS